MNLDPTFSLPPTYSSQPPGADKDKRTHTKNGSQRSSANRLFFGDENSILRAFLPLVTSSSANDSGTSVSSTSDSTLDSSTLDSLQTDSRRSTHNSGSQAGTNLEELFPVCLYGPSGTGKSEVALWMARQSYSQLNLTRIAANDFFRDYLDAIDLDEMQRFRQAFTDDHSIFILDNFEEFATKPAIFDELVFLLDNAKRLIVTSSKNPADLPDLPYRLTSRLLSGLAIPLDVPSPLVRQLILQQEVVSYGSQIADDAASWLVENMAHSIPEIKKIVSRMRIHLDFRNPILLESVQKIFCKQVADIPPLTEIAKIVAKNQLLKVSDLKSQSRKRSIVQARGIAVYVGRELFKYKYEELGRYFGNRDHSTIMHAHKKFKNEIKLDAELKKCVDEISSTIQQKRDT